MSGRRKISIALCMLWLVTAGASTTKARDVQPKPSLPIPSNATIYFLRPEGLIITPWSPEIRVDGRVVGKLPAGTYFAVSRPAGHHTLEIQGGILDTGWESEVELVAGQTYFIETGTQQTGGPGYRGLIAALSGTTGKQLPGRGLNASFSFFTLDAERGRAEITKLKHVTR